MKKMFVIMCLLLASKMTIAQDSLVIKAKRVSEKDMPATVIATHKKDFPDGQILQYYAVPAEVVDNEWVISESGNWRSSDRLDKYSVLYKTNKGTIASLYSKDGTLLISQVRLNNVALPQAVTKSIMTKYPGYEIASDKYRKVIDHTGKKEYYKVTISQTGTVKTVVLKPDGTFINAK